MDINYVWILINFYKGLKTKINWIKIIYKQKMIILIKPIMKIKNKINQLSIRFKIRLHKINSRVKICHLLLQIKMKRIRLKKTKIKIYKFNSKVLSKLVHLLFILIRIKPKKIYNKLLLFLLKLKIITIILNKSYHRFLTFQEVIPKIL